MPTPREAYQNTVEEQGYSGARVRAADFGATGQIIGRAVSGFGQDVNKVASDLDDIQTIYATAAAKEADTQAAMAAMAVTTGFERLQKADAVGAKEQALADLDAVGKEQSAQLKDKRAQAIFRDAFQQRRLAFMERISRHESQEVEKWETDASLAREETSIQLAADSYSDEPMMLSNIATAENERAGRMKGAAPEEIALARREVRSKALATAWTQIEDPLAKEAFREKFAADIDPITESRLIERNAPGLFDARGDLIEADFFKTIATTPAPTEPGQGDAPAQMAQSKPINPVSGRDYDPTGGLSRRTGDAASHARRGSHNKGIDYAAPAGTPIRPPTSGVVSERGYDPTNGNFVKVKYADGNTGIFIHLKGPPPVKDGDPVDPGTIIGSVGNTGKSRGNHVHYSVRGADGNYIDPDTIDYKGGNVQQPRLRAQDSDTSILYDRAYAYADEKNLSPRETEQLLKRIDVRANRERGLKQDRDRVNGEAAMEVVAALGEGLTKRSQIPNYADLAPSDRIQIDNIIEANTRPPAVDPNSETWRTLRELKEDDPMAFASLDARALAGKITDGQVTAVIAEQAALRNKDGTVNTAAVDNYTRVRDVAATFVPRLKGIQGSVNENNERDIRDKYIAAVERRIAKRIADNGGKDISLREYQQIAGEEAMVVYVNGKAVQKFEAEGTPRSQMRVGKIDAAKIVWRRMYPGVPYPSDAELIKMAE